MKRHGSLTGNRELYPVEIKRSTDVAFPLDGYDGRLEDIDLAPTRPVDFHRSAGDRKPSGLAL